MTLTWYGTASLMLRDGDTAIAFDPFDGISVGNIKTPPEKLTHEEKYKSADAVFVTHGHFDHIYHIPRLYSGSKTNIYCTQTPAKKLISLGIDKARIQEINSGWQGNVGGFSVRTWQGRHCRFNPSLIIKTVFSVRFVKHPAHLVRLLRLLFTYHENNEILFYELERSGVRIQIMGSMNLDKNTDYPTGADALILPFQGRDDIDTYALDIIARLCPKAVFIDHNDNSFEPLTSDIDASGFISNVKNCFNICVQTLEKEETLIFNEKNKEEIENGRELQEANR